MLSDHCIDILRQKLVCDVDVGLMTHYWVSRRKAPWPNFNIVHKCRNFDGVVEWSKKHNLPRVDLTPPDNNKGMDPPP